MNNLNHSRTSISQGLIDSLPSLAAYFPLGVVWGLLWEQAGLSPIWGILFSCFVYAGAVQFLALSLLSAGATMTSLLLTTLPIALRNSFYTTSMLEKLPQKGLSRWYCAFGLVDIPFAIFANKSKEETRNLRYTLPLFIATQSYWVMGTACGVFFGSFIPDGIANLDFALPALIAVLAYDQLTKGKSLKQSLKPLSIAMLAALVSIVTFGSHWFLIAVLICSTAAVFLRQEVGS